MAQRGKTFTLNAKEYVYHGAIRREAEASFGPEFRTVGQQRFQDIRNVTQVKLPSPIYGFGRRRISDWDDPRQFLQFWDSNAETRFPSGVYGSLLVNDSVGPTNGERIRASAEFKGDLWALWERDGGAADKAVAAKKLTGSTVTWEGGGDLYTAGSVEGVGLDIFADKTHLVALIARNNDIEAYRSTDGATWSAPTAQIAANLLTNNITANEDIDAGLLESILGELVAVVWHESNGTITFYSSTNAGDNWTDEAVDIPSGNGPTGVAVMPGPDGDEKLYVGTREGVYEVDTSPATWTYRRILRLPTSDDNCRRMTLHQGILWVPVSQGADAPAPIYAIIPTRAGYTIDTTMGLDINDGVPDTYFGPIRSMKSAGKFLFIAGGVAKSGREPFVLCHNGLGWHRMAAMGQAGSEWIEWLDVSDADDNNMRLHFSERTGAATSDPFNLSEPLANPESGVTPNRNANSLLERPELDGGMPNTDTNWLQYYADAADLSADNTGEHIAVSFGVNGAVATTSTLTGSGREIISGDKDADFPDNGATARVGTSGISIQLRETLKRDAAVLSHTPILRNTILRYLKRPNIPDRWLIAEVDLAATAARMGTKVQTVLDNLITARDSVTLISFNWRGLSAAVNVLVDDLRWTEEYSDEAMAGHKRREATISLILREAL